MIETITHLPLAELEAGLPLVRQSPKEDGLLKAIVIRPETDARILLDTAQLSPNGGVHGDRWAKTKGAEPPDVNAQITLINTRSITLIAQSEDRWALAGDNLYVDFDIGEENLQPGDQLSIGSALLVVTSQPHNGCDKFAQRYGRAAMRFVNTPAGRHLHLRGIYAKVVQAGSIQVGDSVQKV
jgi:MOSC domain-containing protein YiiM